MVSTTLEGNSQVLFAVTLIFCIMCLVVITLRCFTRMAIRGFGPDDWLMAIGAFFGTGTFITVLLGCKAGLGQHDEFLTDSDYVNIKKSILAFQVLYCITLICVKCSICVALIRLTISKRLLGVLYAVLALSSGYGFVSMMTVLTQCRPIQATWYPSEGTCSGSVVTVNISYFTTAGSIATDLACAIMPYCILWNLQMKTRVKFSVALLLSLGFLASIATLVRIKYLHYYYAEHNLSFGVAYVVLWSIIETAIAIVVGSFPSLKPLVRSVSIFGSNSAQSRPSHHVLDDYQSFALRSVGGHTQGQNRTHISGKGAREHVVEETDSMKEILGDEILVSSEVRIDNAQSGTRTRDGSM